MSKVSVTPVYNSFLSGILLIYPKEKLALEADAITSI
jgi:hypothetical protein